MNNGGVQMSDESYNREGTEKTTDSHPQTSPDSDTRLEVEHLNVYYGDFRAVKDVNLSIKNNRVTAIIGP